MTTRRHPAASLVPIVAAAQALGLNVVGRRVRCFNGRGHRSGDDRNPSLTLFPDVGRFKCFVCGVRGDAIDLVRTVLGLSFRDAVAWLQRLAGGQPPMSAGAGWRPTVVRRGAEVADVYQALFALTATPAPNSPAGRYLLGRGIGLETAALAGAREIEDASSLWASLRQRFDHEQLQASGLVSRRGGFLFAQHRLVFIYMDDKAPVFVQARDTTGTARPKELRPAGVPCPLPFNANVLLGRPDSVYVCEGCIDTLSAVELGFPAVGVPGVQAFRDEWFSLFRGVGEVRIVFDADEAGRRQGAELRSRFRLNGIRADAYHPAQGKDMNELLLALREGDRS